MFCVVMRPEFQAKFEFMIGVVTDLPRTRGLPIEQRRAVEINLDLSPPVWATL